MNRKTRGFTLVEILIVVIILGILAAIVIPQFTEASTDARKSSVASTLQTIRSQIELFKVQHNDIIPGVANDTDGTAAWKIMLKYTDQVSTKITDTTGIADKKDLDKKIIYGPYLQQAPLNPMNNLSGVLVVTTSSKEGDDAPSVGWVFNSDTGEVYATDKDGKVTLKY